LIAASARFWLQIWINEAIRCFYTQPGLREFLMYHLRPISFPTVIQQYSERTATHHTNSQLLLVLIGRDVWRSRYFLELTPRPGGETVFTERTTSPKKMLGNKLAKAKAKGKKMASKVKVFKSEREEDADQVCVFSRIMLAAKPWQKTRRAAANSCSSVSARARALRRTVW
jgi:hypothetical protein